MSYNVILVDPRPASKDAMVDLLKSNAPVVGIEFTLPALVPFVESNIDDQHVARASNRAACEVALEVELPSVNATLAIVRPDTDALLAVAILNERVEGRMVSGEMEGRVAQIAQMDTFANGEWPGRRPLTLKEDETGTEGLGLIAMDFKRPIQDRVALIQQWLVSGDCDDLDVARQQAVEMFNKSVESSEVSVIDDEIALVESSHLKATTVGYHFAPVLIIRNPSFRFAGGDPHIKYTICQWKDGYIDIPGLVQDVNEVEECGGTWGGSKTICGSPQGASSSLDIEQIVALVKRHKV